MQTCKVPFTGLYLQTTGNIVLCCHSQKDTLAHINDIDDLESFYNNIKDGGNNIIDYDYESTTTHHVLVTIDYEDFVRLKDDNLLIEY